MWEQITSDDIAGIETRSNHFNNDLIRLGHSHARQTIQVSVWAGGLKHDRDYILSGEFPNDALGVTRWNDVAASARRPPGKVFVDAQQKIGAPVPRAKSAQCAGRFGGPASYYYAV
jgi:hypothetical protein